MKIKTGKLHPEGLIQVLWAGMWLEEAARWETLPKNKKHKKTSNNPEKTQKTVPDTRG